MRMVIHFAKTSKRCAENLVTVEWINAELSAQIFIQMLRPMGKGDAMELFETKGVDRVGKMAGGNN